MWWPYALVMLLGCPKQQTVRPVVESPATVGMVQIQTMQEGSPAPPVRKSTEDERMLAVFEGSQPVATACYERALEVDPYAYGEVVVRFTVGADGRVVEAVAALETVGDEDLTACVEAVVMALEFPVPSSGEYSGRYPYVFVTDLTPLEIVRALKINYGLMPAEETEEQQEFPALEHEPGTVSTW